MNNSVNIKQIQSLEDLKNALHRFGSEVGQSLDRVSNSLNKIHDKIQCKFISDQRELEHCIRIDRSISNVATAKRKNAARLQLNKTRKCLLEFEKQFLTFQKIAAGMKRLIYHNGTLAQLILHNKIIEIEKYMAISTGHEQMPQAQELVSDNSSESLPQMDCKANGKESLPSCLSDGLADSDSLSRTNNNIKNETKVR